MFKLFRVGFKDEIGLIHFSVSKSCIIYPIIASDPSTVPMTSNLPLIFLNPFDESSSNYYIARWDLFVSLFRLRLTVGGAGMYESYFDNFVLP